ncbi:ABC transporter substrate-binding protein [Microbacterium sp. A82]|uniref:ABC transporter substrate-binding protein n=1 Tax=Microbacterium sp. A82 TaxID=3450452 RepID=UPI003F382F41
MVFSRGFGRSLSAALAAGVLVCALAACSGGEAGGSVSGGSEQVGEPRSGGSLVVASLSEMPGFDPVKLIAVGTGIERAAQVMDTLMYRDDATGEVKPKLAESLESDDGATWVLSLRDGIEFTDGNPLDAEAVVFNIERHMAEGSTSAAKSMLSDVTDIEVTGEYEVTITLNAPSGSFPLALASSSPASLIGSPAALADPDAFNEDPVGAGPFIFKSWTRDSELTLVRNDQYHGEPAHLDEVVFRVLPDPQSRVDAVMSGDVDVSQITGTSWAAAEANPSLTVVNSPVGGQVLVPNATKAPGDDIRVREAIGLATDAAVANAIVFPGSDLWDLNRDCLPYPTGAPACVEGAAPTPDLEKAKALIAEYVADGGSVAVDFVAPAMTDEVSYYQRQLDEIGLDVTMQVTDVASFQAASISGDYDVLWGITASAGYPTVWRYMSSQGVHWGKVVYPEMDEALERARDELELDARNAAWREVSEIVTEKQAFFWTTPYSSATAYKKSVHLGSEEFPFQGTLMVYFQDAWIEG